jgi:hypothetical protein
MRRLSIPFTALLVVTALAAPSMASAEEIPRPTVKVKAAAVKIPGFGGTGDFYGRGADVEATLEIEGKGYAPTPKNPEGGIPPISEVNVYLPRGTKLDMKDFKTACSEATLKNIGSSGCPPRSRASGRGTVLGEVTIGGEHVPEEASLEAFFGPSGSMLFFTRGTTPVSLEVVSTGRYVHASGKYAWELKTLVPPVPSLPGAPLASAHKIHIRAGAAFRRHGKVISFGTVPKRGECPKGGFYGKTEVIFGGEEGGERNFGFPAKTVTTVIRVPCPKH